jgi:hypothetical protein
MAIEYYSPVDINGDLTVSGTLDVSGDTTITNGLHVHHDEGLEIGDTGNNSTARTTLTSFTSGGNSRMKIKGGNFIHDVTFETSKNDFEYAELVSSYNNSNTTFKLHKSNSDTTSTEATTTISTGDSSLAGSLSVSGALTVGADTSGYDVTFFGSATGEKMIWDSSESQLKITHDTDDYGLGIFTVSSATMTQPQVRVGRDEGQYWGVYTNDRNAVLIHRQDESSGTMNTIFQQWDSNTSDTTGTWQFQSGDGSGSSLSTAMTLTQAGNLEITGTLTLPNSQTLTASSGNITFSGDITCGDDLFMPSAGVINFNSGDMTITHSSNKLTISGGTTTINSLELGAADHVIEDGANILDENDNTLISTSGGDIGLGGNLTVGGTITTPSDIIHTGDTDTKISFGTNTVTVTAGNVNTVVASQEGASITKRKFAKTSNTDGTADGDVVYLGNTTSMTTGAIYHFKSDGTWELADADSAANCDGLLGVALGSSSDDNGVLLRGMVTLDHDPGAVGDVLFLSTTAGDATATAPSGNGDIVRVIGYCLDASNGQIFFNPDGTFVEVTA